jgi:anti-sigma factor RsiW
MNLVADDVQSVVFPGSGHWVAEQALEELLTALTAFLAAYRDGEAAAYEAHERSAHTRGNPHCKSQSEGWSAEPRPTKKRRSS